MKNVEIAEGGIGRRLNGTRSIITDEPNTSLMDFWVDADDRKTKTLYITQNGSYNAEDDGVYAYSSITVSVRGGSSGSNSGGGGGGGGGGGDIDIAVPTFPEFTDEDGNPLDPTLFPEIPLIDIEDIETPALIPTIEDENGNDTPIDQLFPEILEDPLADVGEVKIPDTVGEEGSAITGIDPEDGYTYMVGVDENGNLDIEKVPTGISVTPPTQTEYEFGQPIDYDGMEVTLVDKDGNVVKTKEYPTGKVPIDELINSGELPETAPDKQHVKGTYTFKADGIDLGFDPQGAGGIHYEVDLYSTYNKSDVSLGGTFVIEVCGGSNDSVWGMLASDSRIPISVSSTTTIYDKKRNPLTGEIILEVKEVRTSTESIDPYLTFTQQGKTAYFYYWGFHYWGHLLNVSPEIDMSGYYNSGNEGLAAWTAVYGRASAQHELDASWVSPYSGEVYEDGTIITLSEPEYDTSQG